MADTTDNTTQGPRPSARHADLDLPVLGSTQKAIRPSRMTRWRALSLTLVHVLIIGHIIQWLITGRTLSPVEPAEAMYTLNDGHLNAGFIFFAAALASTLVFGRFVCGWGCHLVAYQDICASLMKRMGIKPKPFRSRILVFAPLALSIYMFVWPSAYRWWIGAAVPPITNHLMTTRLWATLPGWGITILTIVVCGFVIVYFFGSKGFCTYACPYGGFFRLLDPASPGRIIVTDDCKHCGHCTATCTSNVRVHEEVARYGMVVDPGCMKCMDCVSVCPNDALYFGFKKPSLAAKPTSAGRKVSYDFSLAEELAMVVVAVVALLCYRGLYGLIPLLLAMAMAGLTAYFSVKSWRLVRSSNVRVQNLQLKRGGRFTLSGKFAACFMVVLFGFTAHSGAVQYQSWRGLRQAASLTVGDEVWAARGDWWDHASDEQRAVVNDSLQRLERVSRWGLLPTPRAIRDSVWLYLAKGQDDEAERAVRELIEVAPDLPDAHRGLAGVLRKTGRLEEAEREYKASLTLDDSFGPARRELATMLAAMGRVDDAVAVYAGGSAAEPDEPVWRLAAGQLLVQAGRGGEAIGLLEEAIKLNPSLTFAHYFLGIAHLERNEVEPAIVQLKEAVTLEPTFALSHYNLGVATFMAGRPAEGVPHVQEAIRLNPTDPDPHGFLSVVWQLLGDEEGARKSAAEFDRLGGEWNSTPDS